ncbi:hypothetical protein BC943DRAFT_20240 [Umbelopsis sp. AD052]|nr:hypothetical protein BC943DRAFT_20240 [Umbelopsis sp. AD052]
MDMDDFLEMYKSKVLCDTYHLTTKHRSSLNQVITREMSLELNTDSESNLNADDMTVSTTSQEAHLPSVRSLGPRRNQSWVLRNGHAVTVTINSVLKLKCIYCNAFVSYNNYSSSPMKRHLATRHMIDIQSPRRGDAQFSGDFTNEQFHSSVQFSADKLRYLLVRMAVDCKLPFQFIESVSFRSVVDYLLHTREGGFTK